MPFRSPLRVAIFILLALLALLGATAAILLLSARAEAEAGLSEIHAAEALLTTAQLKRAPVSQIQQAEVHLQKARDDFSSAFDRLSPLGPLLSASDWLPNAGHRLSGASTAAAMARDASEGA